MVKPSAGKAANSKASDSSPVVERAEPVFRNLASTILPPSMRCQLLTGLRVLASVCLGHDRASIRAHKERDFERRPGMLGQCGIVSGGYQTPITRRLARRQIDPADRTG